MGRRKQQRSQEHLYPEAVAIDCEMVGGGQRGQRNLLAK